MIKKTLGALLITIGMMACSHQIKPEQLYGEWDYIKIDHPKADDPTDTVSKAELLFNKPYISFEKNGQLSIIWGGKVLSHGTYHLSGDNINYTEQLPGGKTRAFPFCVSRLDNKTIVFETVGNDASRVTAIKK